MDRKRWGVSLFVSWLLLRGLWPLDALTDVTSKFVHSNIVNAVGVCWCSSFHSDSMANKFDRQPKCWGDSWRSERLLFHLFKRQITIWAFAVESVLMNRPEKCGEGTRCLSLLACNICRL